MASLEVLFTNGVTLDMLAPRIIEDLDSGEFSRQNPAARFLYHLPPPYRDQSLDPESEFSLGSKLVEATVGGFHSFGAEEAMNFSYVSSWPVWRVIGGVRAALAQSGGEYLRLHSSPHLSKLIAAADGNGCLREVLDAVRNSLNASLQDRSVMTVVDREILELADKYTGANQELLRSFGDWLSSHASTE